MDGAGDRDGLGWVTPNASYPTLRGLFDVYFTVRLARRVSIGDLVTFGIDLASLSPVNHYLYPLLPSLHITTKAIFTSMMSGII